MIFDLSEVNTLYTETTMSSSSAIYLVGYAVIIVGLALGAHYLEIPTRWIVVGVIVLAGMGLTGLAKSRQGRRSPRQPDRCTGLTASRSFHPGPGQCPAAHSLFP